MLLSRYKTVQESHTDLMQTTWTDPKSSSTSEISSCGYVLVQL